MKHIVFSGMLLLATLAGETMAACPGTPVTNLNVLLPGKMVCKSNGTDWVWQEYHGGGGILTDYKKGSDPNDPTEPVGTWSATPTTVTYNYGPSQIYTYDVSESSGEYTFCLTGSSTPEVSGATLFVAGSATSCGTP